MAGMDFYVKNGSVAVYDVNGVPIISTVVYFDARDWLFVYLRKTATEAIVGAGRLDLPNVEAILTGNFMPNSGSDVLTIQAPSKGYKIRDLRIWNCQKTAEQMNLVRNYLPTPTMVPYSPGYALMLNNGDRYGLQVLANGWLAPSKMPAWVRTPKFARIVRYDGRGEYNGEPWRKELGLGGGQIPPTTWQLGYQYHVMTATGTLVTAPELGAQPGNNAYWQGDTALGFYVKLAGLTPSGFTAIVTATGSTVPWPNQMLATNPNTDQIWLKDDNGVVYLCKLEASGNYGAAFVASTGTLSNQQDANTISFLAGTGSTLGVDSFGSVVQKAYAGTVTTPPLYLYLHDVLLEDVGGSQTFQRWTDPSVFGTKYGFPALKTFGQLSLTNTATLLKGSYKLILDVGNIGQADQDFDGFRLDITVADTTIRQTLLPNYSGTGFRGQQEIDFDLDHDVVGEWLLTLSWLNAYSDPARGTARQLIVYGYQVRRLETNLYRVSLAPGGPDLVRYPDLQTLNYGQVPGGWLVAFNSHGTIVVANHEGTVYPENDTARSAYPLANLLTGVTALRREDVIVTSGNFILPDAADSVIMAFGTGLGVSS